MPEFPSKGALHSIIALILFLSVWFVRMIQVNSQSEASFQTTLEQNVEQALGNIDDHIQRFEQQLLTTESADFSFYSGASDYPYYVFRDRRLIYWSDYHYTPKYLEISGDFNYKYLVNSEGKFILRKSNLDDDSGRETIFVLTLVRDSKIINQYIKSEYNPDLFESSDFELGDIAGEPGFQLVSHKGQALFSVRFGPSYRHTSTWMELTTYVLIAGFFVYLILAFIELANYFTRKHTYTKGLLWLSVLVVLSRALMLLTQFPFRIIPVGFFDVQNYASSVLNPSLGDLFLNLLGLFGIAWYLFNAFYRSMAFKRIIASSHRSKHIITALLAFLTNLWLGLHYYIVESMSFHSQWSMDVTENLEFNYLKIISYLLFFLSGVIYFLMTHISYKLLFKINDLKKPQIHRLFIMGTVVYIGFSLLLGWEFKVLVVVNLIFYLVLFWFQLPRYIARIQYLTFVYFFICGIPVALIGAYANYQYYQSNTGYLKDKEASQLLVENDPFAEYIIAEAAERIRSDSWIQGQILNPYTSKRIINQYIRSKYISNYLDQYDIQIFVFNSRGNPFEASGPGSNYFQLKEQVEGFETEGTEGLYFINELDPSAVKRYRCFIEIRRRSLIAGYIILNLKLKRFIPKTVYPMLLRDSRITSQPDYDFDLSYGVFSGARVIYNYGAFNYRKEFPVEFLSNEKIFKDGVKENRYNHFGYRMEDGRTLIISSKEYPFKNVLANFSFFFLIYVFSILVVLMILAVYARIKGLKQNYATRIQLYLNLAFFTPLLVLSITTLSLIIQAYRSNLEAEYLEKAESLSANIAPTLFDYQEQKISKVALLNRIYEIAQYAGLDINLFNNSGWLIASSQPLIYDNELLSNYINPQGYIDIAEGRADHTVLNESIGTLKYQNTYTAINSFESGALIGILSLPFYASKKDLDNQIINVLINIINIFTFVFIGFLIVSFFASSGLTFPLKLITRKIQKTTLSGYNEPLSWKSDDEIGLMVKEYNRMLVNLEESKKALAKSEKETAWREMARQVAHEIKNPLTPMKLTLQHMRRRLDVGSEEQSKEKARQIDTLLEQINTLSDIATSFSAFAKMPIPQNEVFDLRKLLLETIALYDKKEFGEIQYQIDGADFLVNGDRQWIGRAISNIIINGFQASQEQDLPIIRIRMYPRSQVIRMEIEDNGGGIPDELSEKIFLPNFSTKFSGSGLGLAIAKKGIEHAEGKIWFKSRTDVGTVFYIELKRVDVA